MVRLCRKKNHFPAFYRLEGFPFISCFLKNRCHIPSLVFTEHFLYCTCRLKSLTLFSHWTAKAAPVSNTNIQLSSYICSGHGSKNDGRSKNNNICGPVCVCWSLHRVSCPALCIHLGALCCSLYYRVSHWQKDLRVTNEFAFAIDWGQTLQLFIFSCGFLILIWISAPEAYVLQLHLYFHVIMSVFFLHFEMSTYGLRLLLLALHFFLVISI